MIRRHFGELIGSCRLRWGEKLTRRSISSSLALFDRPEAALEKEAFSRAFQMSDNDENECLAVLGLWSEYQERHLGPPSTEALSAAIKAHRVLGHHQTVVRLYHAWPGVSLSSAAEECVFLSAQYLRDADTMVAVLEEREAMTRPVNQRHREELLIACVESEDAERAEAVLEMLEKEGQGSSIAPHVFAKLARIAIARKENVERAARLLLATAAAVPFPQLTVEPMSGAALQFVRWCVLEHNPGLIHAGLVLLDVLDCSLDEGFLRTVIAFGAASAAPDIVAHAYYLGRRKHIADRPKPSTPSKQQGWDTHDGMFGPQGNWNVGHPKQMENAAANALFASFAACGDISTASSCLHDLHRRNLRPHPPALRDAAVSVATRYSGSVRTRARDLASYIVARLRGRPLDIDPLSQRHVGSMEATLAQTLSDLATVRSESGKAVAGSVLMGSDLPETTVGGHWNSSEHEEGEMEEDGDFDEDDDDVYFGGDDPTQKNNNSSAFGRGHDLDHDEFSSGPQIDQRWDESRQEMVEHGRATARGTMASALDAMMPGQSTNSAAGTASKVPVAEWVDRSRRQQAFEAYCTSMESAVDAEALSERGADPVTSTELWFWLECAAVVRDFVVLEAIVDACGGWDHFLDETLVHLPHEARSAAIESLARRRHPDVQRVEDLIRTSDRPMDERTLAALATMTTRVGAIDRAVELCEHAAANDLRLPRDSIEHVAKAAAASDANSPQETHQELPFGTLTLRVLNAAQTMDVVLTPRLIHSIHRKPNP